MTDALKQVTTHELLKMKERQERIVMLTCEAMTFWMWKTIRQ